MNNKKEDAQGKKLQEQSKNELLIKTFESNSSPRKTLTDIYLNNIKLQNVSFYELNITSDDKLAEITLKFDIDVNSITKECC